MSSIQNKWVIMIIVLSLALIVLILILTIFKDMTIGSALDKVNFIKRVFVFDK